MVRLDNTTLTLECEMCNNILVCTPAAVLVCVLHLTFREQQYQYVHMHDRVLRAVQNRNCHQFRILLPLNDLTLVSNVFIANVFKDTVRVRVSMKR
eukprot:m.255660 g.255660  ORF g.255660 m.255660 type:complete len:96 (+) comp15502_c0_seq1:2341-2628(+)